jgi:hypothetical protein
MVITDWVTDSDASNHTTPYLGGISNPLPPLLFHPSSIVVGNGSVLPITPVGDSVFHGPFYRNDVMIAPDLIQSLLSYCYFTTNNSYSMEFDPFGLFVKDLATRSMIARHNSSGPLYTIPLPALTTSITDAPPYALVVHFDVSSFPFASPGTLPNDLDYLFVSSPTIPSIALAKSTRLCYPTTCQTWYHGPWGQCGD